MRKKFDKLLLGLAHTEVKIHFIVLSEVWISSDEVKLFKIPE